MAKSKTFTYEGDGPVSVAIPGTASMVNLQPGDTIEAENDAQAEAFEANPDLTKGGSVKRESDSDSESKGKSRSR